MEKEKRKKILNILMISLMVVLFIIAIVEAVVLLKLNNNLEKIKNDYSIIENQLEEN